MRTIAASLVLLLLIAPAARAEPVQLRHGGLRLNGELVTAKSGLAGNVALIVHGTLAHHRMEIVAALQKNLAERGVSSLAVTLSLGIDDRRGMLDCTATQRHRNADAGGEIDAWLDWLAAKGARKATVIGHSRGGYQVALRATKPRLPLADRAVLLAPTTSDPAETAADYERAHGKPLQPILAAAARKEALSVASRTQGAPRATDRNRADAAAGHAAASPLLTDIGFLSCKSATVSAGTFIDYYGPRRQPLQALLAEQKIATLVVVAGGDTVVRGLEKRLHADKGWRDVKVVDGADHFFQDLYGEEAADAIVAFMGG